MTEEVFIPKLGQTVEEVTIIEWLVKDGEKVSAGQEILKVETDKAVFEVEAADSGYIHVGPFEEGAVVPVLDVVAVIGKQDDVFQRGAEKAEQSSADTAEVAVEAMSSSLEKAETSVNSNGWVFASPLAKKVAKEHGVDLAKVTPTGRHGSRIVLSDVRKYLETFQELPSAKEAAPATTAVASAPSQPAETFYPNPVTSTQPLKGVRGVVANRMWQSSYATAPVSLLMEVDATEMVRMRKSLKEQVQSEWGFTPGYNDILAKIVSLALAKFPYMNARIRENAIEKMGVVNLGMAVDTERGLIVPVIRNSDQKSIYEFGKEFRTLIDRTKTGKTMPDDLEGGTFTITNLGMYEVDAFTPIINLPEAAILGVGRIAQKMVVQDGKGVIRDIMVLSLVFDHRLVDGAPAARFLQYIKHLVENPYLLMADLK